MIRILNDLRFEPSEKEVLGRRRRRADIVTGDTRKDT